MPSCRAKPNVGIQLIAIQEVCLRMAALCALAAGPILGESLRPLQLGVGTCARGDTEAIGHSLRRAFDADASSSVLQIDFANAFNRLHLAAILQAVAQSLLEPLPYVVWLYGEHLQL
jgi:hypothetical protein